MSSELEIGFQPQIDTGSGADTAGKKKEVKQSCRFFNSRSGCKAGEQCRFDHVTSRSKDVQKDVQNKANASGSKSAQKSSADASNEAAGEAVVRQYKPPTVDKSRVVSRPVSKVQVEDPREFQVGQIRRRFNPKEEIVNGGAIFHLNLAPSDPDFPFELESISISLTVPLTYPNSGKPSIRVINTELERGFQLNIERGFQELATSFPDATLLGLFNRLDKELEALLSKEKSEVVNFKFVKPQQQEPVPSVTPTVAHAVVRQPPLIIPVFQPAFTSEQKLNAQTKRQADVRQVVARLGRLGGFVQHTDGVTFTVPFQPLKKNALPPSLQKQSSLRLVVPEMYNLHHPRIELYGNASLEARQVENAFIERAKLFPDTSLLAHMNYLSSHAHTMAAIDATPEPPKPAPTPTAVEATPALQDETKSLPTRARPQPDADMSEKGHVQHIPRPPEWGIEANEEDDSSSDDSLSTDHEYDSDTDDSDGDGNANTNTGPSMPAEKGIMLSFPGLEMHSVELLELVSLNIIVKCDRCKDTTEISRLRNNTAGDHTGMKDESCKKCANNLAAGWRQDLVHANSSRAGYLDLDGCTVVDMLPSNFIPTCGECSTPYPAPGIAAVRGDAAMAICRECHKKMTFRIPETKFLHVSAAAVRATRGPIRKKVKENLGIVAGQELPQRGRCKHYSKSYRWFRFSCCQRVFPCDRCHDEASDHPEEHANRMLCGFCSREQNYSPEQCHFCHNSLIKRRGQGFWEGGKGTRDPTKMSRKDPRKYKRRPGSKPKA